ncbi:MAG: hypothetical protein QXK65_01220 [Candidatus Micrarchaeaceae archaeon]
MDEETVIYLTFTSLVALIAVFGSATFGKGIMPDVILLLSFLTIGFLLLFNFADFVIFPLFTSLLGISFQPANNYYIVKSQNAVIKNVNELFYATGYLTFNLFPYVFKEERVEENIEEQLQSSPDKWERAIMSISFPFKLHVLSAGLDVQKTRDELEGKRSYQEFQLSRLLQNPSANDVAVTNIQRQINTIQAKIDRISQGEKPIAALMYIETTAVGISEKAALDSLSEQIKQLQVSFSSFDVDLSRIAGRELYTLFMYNFMIPTSIEMIGMQFNQQG